MKYNYHYCKFTAWSTNLAPDVHANSCPHRGSRRGGGGGGGGSSVGGTRARVFDMFQYFETILPAVESL